MSDERKSARIVRGSAEGLVEVVDAVAVEEPLEIVLAYPRGGRLVEFPLSMTMRTPGNDEELVAGLLFCEGMIAGASWIDRFSQERGRITVHLDRTPVVPPGRRERRFLSSSSCGVCGKSDTGALPRTAAPNFLPTAPLVSSRVLCALPQRLRELQESFAATGGMHAAARFTTDGTCRGIFEDVGRHNALDKLIGEALLGGFLPTRDEVLLVSGRVSYELVQKSLAAGFPVLAAIGSPSSLAIEMCNTARQTLVGFLRANRYNIYSHPQRILPHPPERPQ